MVYKQRRPAGQGFAHSDSLGVAILNALTLADEAAIITPVKAVFGTVGVVLTIIKATMVNEPDYVDLGRDLTNLCGVLDRGVNERRLDELSQSVREAIEQLVRIVAEIQKEVTGMSGRSEPSGFVPSDSDTETVAAWRRTLKRIDQVLDTDLALSAPGSELRRAMLMSWGDAEDRHYTARTSFSPGELPPHAPRACFGREELIETVVSLAENFMPIALVGDGGIGKTSVALTVLHDDRIKKRFGYNRRFIRCDQFPVSRTHFLSRLSDAIGAGVKNPEKLTPLRPFLSSREMIIVLDNAESILDSRGTESQEIFSIVEELCLIPNISLCITSRTSTVPLDCRCLDVPTLSPDAALRAFYRIYDKDEQRNRVNDILKQLEFHPLSITLLATVAQHDKWDTNQLADEWERYRAAMLHTKYDKSLAAIIELSLASPTFQELGPHARELLGVVAFFPQGVYEKNLDWLFPGVPDRADIFSTFCILSLTHRSNGFITMSAPLRDYLRPKDPNSSQLLCATKQCYFTRLAVDISHTALGLERGRWITSEDVNVEHLLNVFTTIDKTSDDVWDACGHFMKHLSQHKPRPVGLGSRCEALSDDHWSKPECLFWLSRLFGAVGNHVESKRLLTHTLCLWKERGSGRGMARTLTSLCDTNRLQGLYKEGIQEGGKAVKVCGQLGDIGGLARSLHSLALVLDADNRRGCAEEAASLAVKLYRVNSDQFGVCRAKYILGKICHSKGENRKAKKLFDAAHEIATTIQWHDQLSSIHHSLAWLSFDRRAFEDAHYHIERAKSHAINDKHKLGHGMEAQAYFLYTQRRFKEARSEAVRCIGVYKELGIPDALERCQVLLKQIKLVMGDQITPGESG
ncbi:hypothetical protein BJ322DRAFT_1108203 [Thelephora terrestris]|uniref:NACHT domain-containing protein n=1 Tax=Thelephora terrestris TaxID=56493 RepID=A0A9P6L869_9AGAM|nr:hypothetical protein BJ322DRAFT_1108203 [Thelephora terrestris]